MVFEGKKEVVLSLVRCLGLRVSLGFVSDLSLSLSLSSPTSARLWPIGQAGRINRCHRLVARRLVALGVNMVQVNLGNMGTWDLHDNAFPLAKNFLFPPTDLAISALLDDLTESGMLEETMVVIAGEFGRTPRIFNGAPNVYKTVGRGHWGPCQTVMIAGGGVAGGRVIGSSDKSGAYPASDTQTPESFASTIYHALGIPRSAHWHDAADRPYPVYRSEPIGGLFA